MGLTFLTLRYIIKKNSKGGLKMDLEFVLAYDMHDEIKKLFDAYTRMLVENEPGFDYYLGLQNYDDEVKDLRSKYGLPGGRLYIAIFKGRVAGCIALRKFDEENCEMKRLYVKPDFRDKGIGRKLIDKLIEDGKEIGYKYMLLDTLPSLNIALSLYESYGFKVVPPHSHSPIENSIFMRLNLDKSPI